MDKKKYSITLSDGTIIENLTLNGNNFISARQIDEATFRHNCSPVIISDGENSETHENMELVQITERDGEYWFVLRDLTKAELDNMKMQSDIEYIAMMSEIEL